MQTVSIERMIPVIIGVVMLVFAIGFASDAGAQPTESLITAPDNVVSVAPNSTGLQVVTNVIHVTPGFRGLHIYTIQASITDKSSAAEAGHLTLVHTELRAALVDAGGIFANVIVTQQQELVGAILSPFFFYRTTPANGSGSLGNGAGPTDVLNNEFAGHTATEVDISAVYGVKNDDRRVAHDVAVGIQAEVAPF